MVRWKRSVLGSVSTIVLAVHGTAAMAQANTVATDSVTDDSTIIVSASRINREGFEAPTPTNVLSAEDINRQGTPSVLELLNTTPYFVDGSSPRTQGISALGNTSEMDLRGLGTTRTLLLVDGRRHPATTTEGTVNLELLPSSLIERVEIVTGGASAAWGSDAVSGVVNVVLKRAVEGIEVEAQSGINGAGDGRETRASFLGGGSFGGGRGHVIVAAEAFRTDGVRRQDSRSWSQGLQLLSNPLDTSRSDGIPAQVTRLGVRFANATPGGTIVDASGSVLSSGPLANLKFGPGGTLQQFVRGTDPAGGFATGGDGVTLSGGIPLAAPGKRHSLFTKMDYALSDTVTLYAEGSAAQERTQLDSIPGINFAGGGGFGVIPVDITNPYLPAEARQRMIDAGVDRIYLARANTDIGRLDVHNRTTAQRYLLGLRGSIAKDWSFDASYQYSRSEFHNEVRNNVLVANLAAAADVVNGPNGPVCTSGLAGCVPLNLFGEGSPSQAAVDYVTGTAIRDDTITLSNVALTIDGQIAALPAGPIAVAIGSEYREEKGETRFDDASESGAFLIGNGQSLGGKIRVAEAFAEVVVPVLAETPFFNLLELNAAGRWTHYNTVGDVQTYKLGVTWKPIPDLRLRGVYSRDIRAPNIGELFLGQRQGFLSLASDPCSASERAANANFARACSALNIPSTVTAGALISSPFGGNPNLKEETSRTLSAGAVLSPHTLPGLDLSVDYYDIKVSDAISSLPVQFIVDGCYDRNDAQLCNAITRGGDGNISGVFRGQFNIASLRARGVDWSARYSVPLAGQSASLRFGISGTYVIERSQSPDGISTIELAGEVGTNNGLGGTPHWRWNADLGYAGDRFGINGRLRYVGGGKIDNSWTIEDIDNNQVKAQAYVDLSAYVRIASANGKEGVRMFGGIKNLFDKSPPPIATNFILTYATNPGLYDTIGRAFYVGINGKF